MSYQRARSLLLAGGLTVLILTTVVMYVRRVDPVEVAGILLFIPVFVAFVFWNARGGLIAAVLGVILYTLLRYPAIEAVGLDRFGGLIASRAVAYLAFGLIGGVANKQLQSSLGKLELYDQIDDPTGLFNARFFVQDTELEISRADRYQTIFSISLVDIPADSFYSMGRRQRDRSLRDLGRLLAASVRTVDRAVHARDGNKHRLVVVLPETARAGATVFTDRLAEKISEYLSGKGAKIEGDGLTGVALTFPDDQAAIENLRSEFAAIDKTEHPEADSTEAA
jgi:diguanylate cyclase (GGDEF)-like protein